MNVDKKPLGDPMDVQPTPQRQTTPSVKDEPQEATATASWMDNEIELSDDEVNTDLTRGAEKRRIRTMLQAGEERNNAARARLLGMHDFIADARAELEETEAMLKADNEARVTNQATTLTRIQSVFDQSAVAKDIDPAILARLRAEMLESLSEPVPQVQTASTQTVMSPTKRALEPSGGDVHMSDVPSPAMSEPAGSQAGSVEPSSVTKQRSNLALRDFARASITNIKNSTRTGVSNMMTGVSNMTNPSIRRKRHEEESPTIGTETFKKKSKSNLREGLIDEDDLIYDVRGPSPTPTTISHRTSFVTPVQLVPEEEEPESPGQARNVQWQPSHVRRRRGSSRGGSDFPSVRPMQSSQTLYEGSQPPIFSPTAPGRRSDPAASRVSFGFQPAASNAPGSSFLSPAAASRVQFAGHGLQPAVSNAPLGSLTRLQPTTSSTSLSPFLNPAAISTHFSFEGSEAGIETASGAGSAGQLETSSNKSGPPKVPFTLLYWGENLHDTFPLEALNKDVCKALTKYYKSMITKKGSRLRGFMQKSDHTDDSRVDGVCLRCRQKGEAIYCSTGIDQGLHIALGAHITCNDCVLDGTPCGSLVKNASDPTGYAICFWPLPSDRRQGVPEGSMAYFLIEGGVKGERTKRTKRTKRTFASKVKQKIMPTPTRKSERLQKPANRIEEAY
ncbi:hypothetical protein N0V94_004809 [Neodidymelliopsis sp. IMI 364377]|nr:hypothetical protein N0V94_004809 [Neodidymelliopsis sp. IMI 364377]